jgi:hypothetical protein
MNNAWCRAVAGAALAVAASALAQAPADPLAGAERIGGSGRATAFRQNGNVLLAIPASTLGKPMLWYTEVVGMPAGTVASNGLEVNSALVRLERHGSLVHVRDLSTVNQRRAAPVSAGVGGAGPFAGVPARPAHGVARGRPAGGLLHTRYRSSTTRRRRAGPQGPDRPLPAGEGQPAGRGQRPGQAHHLLPGPGIPRTLEALHHRRRAAVAAGVRGSGLLQRHPRAGRAHAASRTRTGRPRT